MAILKSKTTRYEFSLDEMKKLIAQDMGVSVEAIQVNYKISNTSPDWAYNANSYDVTQIEVIVDETKV